VQGRFTSPDEPLYDQNEDEPQSWNLYSYVRNNPLIHVDPNGKETCYYNNGQQIACDDQKGFKINIETQTLTYKGKDYDLAKLDAQTIVRESNIAVGHMQNIPCPTCTINPPQPSFDPKTVRGIPTGNVPQLIPIVSGYRDFADSKLGMILMALTPTPLPKLKFLHSASTWLSGSAKTSFEYWSKQATEKIIESLKPGAAEALRVKANGTIMNGNTRIKVLQERGVDVDSLPREIIN
jgi:hypothetical protein